MKVMVATKDTQGRRRNDFCHARPGELVRFATECDGEQVDGPCGCRRYMVGIETTKATTTVQIVDKHDMTVNDLAKLIRKANTSRQITSEAKLKALARQDAEEIGRIADAFGIGTVLEKRGNTFKERRLER